MDLEAQFSRAVTTLKGFSILLVVLGHFNSPFHTLIYSFHIPLFFFLGGFFLNAAKETGEYIKGSFNRLIVPYFIFGFVGWGINLLKNCILSRPQENITDSFLGLIWWMDAQHLDHYGFVLWFLPALFWARLFVFLLIKHLGKNAPLFLAVFSVTTIYISKSFYLPLGIDKALIAVPWLSFGLVFFRYKNKILSWPFNIIFIPTVVVLILITFTNIQALDLASKNLGNLLPTFAYTFSVLFFLIFACVFYEKNKSLFPFTYLDSFFQRVGMRTLFILVVHPYTNNLSHLLVEYFFRENLWYIKFGVSLIMLFALMHASDKICSIFISNSHSVNPKI